MSQIDQQLKNWFHELQEHDLSDLRGILTGLANVLLLVAAKLPPGPPPAPLPGQGFVTGEGFVPEKGGRDA